METHHIEQIECPECGVRNFGKVEHTVPFYTYYHECYDCGHIIQESEWNEVN